MVLFCAGLAGLLWLSAGSARLALELDTTGKVDRDNDARFELVLRNAGNADLEVLHLAKAELIWEGGRAAMEPLRMMGPRAPGEAMAWPLETEEPIWFAGDSAEARLDLEFTWRSEGHASGSAWKRASWVVPVVLRR